MKGILEELNLTQAEAATRLNVSLPYVKAVCQGKRPVPDAWEGILRGDTAPQGIQESPAPRDTTHMQGIQALPEPTPEYCARYGYHVGTPYKDSNGITRYQTWERIVSIFESARRCMPAARRAELAKTT